MRLACYLMLPLLDPKREQDPAAAPPDVTAGEQPGARHPAQAPGVAAASPSVTARPRTPARAVPQAMSLEKAPPAKPASANAAPDLPAPQAPPAPQATCAGIALHPRRGETAHRAAALRPARRRRRVQAR